jgi:thioredoxin-related protein
MTAFQAAGVPRILAVMLLLSLSARYVAAEEGWLVSLEKAKEQAAKEGKDILMEFTGSDWCPPCKALHSKVLVTDVFMTEVPKQFVLLKLDNPRDKSHQTEEEQAQYKELSAKFAVRGVPTVMLADAQGRPYTQKVGYGGTPAEDYVKELSDSSKIRAERDELLAKADKAEGAEKAKLLDQAISAIGTDLAFVAYKDLVDQVVELDADNQLGLKNKYGLTSALAELKNSRSVNPEEMLAKVDALISEYSPQGEQLQELMLMKGSLQYRTDKDAAKATLEAALKVAPDTKTGKQIEQILERVFKPAEPKAADGENN